jgi:hypothetical protein
MALLSDIGQFIVAIIRQYVILLTGSGIALTIAIVEHVTQKSLPWGSYRTILELAFGLALFLAWREQFQQVRKLERGGLHPKVRRTLQGLIDDGISLRQVIIDDPHDDPWPGLRAPGRNGWMDRVEDYLYQSVGPSISKTFRELGVATGVPPYPEAYQWPSRTRDAIMHLDIRIDYLKGLLR